MEVVLTAAPASAPDSWACRLSHLTSFTQLHVCEMIRVDPSLPVMVNSIVPLYENKIIDFLSSATEVRVGHVQPGETVNKATYVLPCASP